MPRRLSELARYGMSADASLIRRHPDGRRMATLLATVGLLEAKSVDDTLELLDLLMGTELLNKAQTAANKDKVRKHPKLAKASARLAVAVEALFESDGWGGPDEVVVGAVWEAIEAVVSRAELRAAVVLVNENEAWLDAIAEHIQTNGIGHNGLLFATTASTPISRNTFRGSATSSSTTTGAKSSSPPARDASSRSTGTTSSRLPTLS